MNAKQLFVLVMCLAVPLSAGQVSVSLDTEANLDLTYRHPLAGGPLYGLITVGGGDLLEQTQRSTGAPWSPCLRTERLDAEQWHAGIGMGIALGILGLECDIRRHWLDGTITRTGQVPGGPPTLLESRSLDDTWSTGLTGLVNVPLNARLAILVGGGYRWDLCRDNYDLSGPFAFMGVNLTLGKGND